MGRGWSSFRLTPCGRDDPADPVALGNHSLMPVEIRMLGAGDAAALRNVAPDVFDVPQRLARLS